MTHINTPCLNKEALPLRANGIIAFKCTPHPSNMKLDPPVGLWLIPFK